MKSQKARHPEDGIPQYRLLSGRLSGSE